MLDDDICVGLLGTVVIRSFPGGASGKELSCQCRRCKRHWFDPWVGKMPGVGSGNPLQDSCLENSMDRGYGRL